MPDRQAGVDIRIRSDHGCGGQDVHDDADITALRHASWSVYVVSAWRRVLARWGSVPTSASAPALVDHERSTGAPGATTELWPGVSEQFALRVLSLAASMRGYLDTLEAEEEDPDVLEMLYRVDHAATRVQRLAENLQVLAGRRSGDVEGQVMPLIDVIRAGMSAIEHYPRVHIGRVVDLAVVDWAADDVSRVMAELLDNATRYSPPECTVAVSAHLTEQGTVMLRVEDIGIGFDPVLLASMNARLDSEVPDLDPQTPTQMGLAVVQRLARAHGMRVQLVQREPVGTTAMVVLPVPLLCEFPSARARRPRRRPTPRPRPRPDGQAGAGKELMVRSEEIPVTPAANALRTEQAFGSSDAAEPAAGRLPQRVPSSIRQMPEITPFAGSVDPDDSVNQRAWHDDLAAFVAGDAAARPGDNAGSGQPRPEGPTE
jgi:hypothetical protein